MQLDTSGFLNTPLDAVDQTERGALPDRRLEKCSVLASRHTAALPLRNLLGPKMAVHAPPSLTMGKSISRNFGEIGCGGSQPTIPTEFQVPAALYVVAA